MQQITKETKRAIANKSDSSLRFPTDRGYAVDARYNGKDGFDMDLLS
jgi:hypothetical protein